MFVKLAADSSLRYKLVLVAVLIAVLPPIFCLLFIRNVSLTRAQNALDNKDLSGRDTGEVADLAALRESIDWEEGRVRLSPKSPARVLSFSAGAPAGKGLSRTERSLADLRRSVRAGRLTASGGRAGGSGAGDRRGERVRLSPRNSITGLREEVRQLGKGRPGMTHGTSAGESSGSRALEAPSEE